MTWDVIDYSTKHLCRLTHRQNCSQTRCDSWQQGSTSMPG